MYLNMDGFFSLITMLVINTYVSLKEEGFRSLGC